MKIKLYMSWVRTAFSRLPNPIPNISKLEKKTSVLTCIGIKDTLNEKQILAKINFAVGS